MEKINY